MKQPTLSDINQDFQDFQDDLMIRSRKLKILVSLKENSDMDELISLLDLPPEKTIKNNCKKVYYFIIFLINQPSFCYI